MAEPVEAKAVRATRLRLRQVVLELAKRLEATATCIVTFEEESELV